MDESTDHAAHPLEYKYYCSESAELGLRSIFRQRFLNELIHENRVEIEVEPCHEVIDENIGKA